jgi:hypothetical protein
MLTLATIHEVWGDTSLKSLDALVGCNVVRAVFTHGICSCSAILDDHPTMYVVGNRAPDLTTTRTSPSSTPTPTRPEWSMANRRRT